MVINTTLDFIVILSCVIVVVHHVSSDFAFRTHVKLAMFWPHRTDFSGNKIHIFLSVDVHSFGWTNHGVCSLSDIIGRSHTFVNSALTGMKLTIPVISFHWAAWSNFISWMSVFSESLMVLACGFFLNTTQKSISVSHSTHGLLNFIVRSSDVLIRNKVTPISQKKISELW